MSETIVIESLESIAFGLPADDVTVIEIESTGAAGAAGTNGTNGGSTSAWQYKAKTNATSGYPGNGYLLWNNATQTSATSILVSHLTDGDTDIELLLSFFVVNQKIFIQDRDDSSKNQVWLISGTPTVTGANTSTAYYTFPVTLVSSAGGAFTNNHSLLFGQISVATNAVTSATTSDGTATLSLLSATIGNPAIGAILLNNDGSGVFTSTLGALNFYVYPNGVISLASTNTNGVINLNGEAATTGRTIAFPDASGTVALTSDITVTPTNTVTLTNKTLTSPTINSATFGTAATFNATSYTYGTGAATEHMASIVSGSGIGNVFCYDEFVGTSGSGGSIGELGWVGTGSGTIRGNELNHPGIFRQSSATTGNLSLTYLAGAGNPDSFNGLTIEGVFRIGAITNCRHTFGVGYVGQYMTNGYRGITFDPANSANWRLHHRTSAGADTFTDTGKAAVANDWVRVKLTFASGLTTCTIATTSSTTDATVTNSGAYTVGSSAHTPQWVFQSTSGTQTLDVDAFMLHGKTTRL